MYRDIFAKRLRALRLSRGLTLQNVGDAVGSMRHYISNLESARISPSLAMAITLAEFFDVSLDYLVGRSNDPGPGSGGGDEETASSEPAQNPERSEKNRLIGMVQTLHEEDANQVMNYAAFLRHARRREDRRKRRAEGNGT